MTSKNDMAKRVLDIHSASPKGKVGIVATKKLNTKEDLATLYSPGVAIPCTMIKENPEDAYEYTSKGNLVAVISNGTAVLGLGSIGALASKPVMEGKAILLKRFADVDGIDIELDSNDVDDITRTIRNISVTFGGINLEDIKAPECFDVESKLQKAVDIPIFHDDQHGTAIVVVAAMINAVSITKRDIKNVKVVINGAGAAGIACADLIKAYGVRDENIIMCDTSGVIYKGRKEGMNKWKERHAVETTKRTLTEATEGADVFIGVSVKDALKKEMVQKMADSPMIFALANPDPEIIPENARSAKSGAIIATGRSDYPNQINNLLAFPYIFRAALDVRASSINMEMKFAAAHAIAGLAKEVVTDEVKRVYGEKVYGPDYIVPTPFDGRLLEVVSFAVAKAAIESGVSRIKDFDLEKYKVRLQQLRVWLSGMYK